MFLSVLSLVPPTWAADKSKEDRRLEACGQVFKEILDIPDGIPKELLNKAECVIVMPSVLKFAIGVGGDYGRGAITCRTGEHFTGPWSAPALFVGVPASGRELIAFLNKASPKNQSDPTSLQERN